jgi:hypothetical protein
MTTTVVKVLSVNVGSVCEFEYGGRPECAPYLV